MKKGDYQKEYSEAIREKYTTKSGILTLLIANPIWAFLILSFSPQIFDYFKSIVHSVIPNAFIETYFGYLALGIVLSIIAIGINYVIGRFIEHAIP